jgi:hypothetical protein
LSCFLAAGRSLIILGPADCQVVSCPRFYQPSCARLPTFSVEQTVFAAMTLRLVAILGLVAGCASSPALVIHQSPRGAVYLEKAPDRTFQAAHPISLHPAVLSKVLQGVQIQNDRTALDTIFSSQEKTSRVFFDQDIQFLAPLLSSALEQAAPDQVVRFSLQYVGRIAPPGGGAGIASSEPASTPRSETTAGTLYAYGLSLNLTITEFRHRPDRPDAINMPNRRLADPTGLGGRRVAFQPDTALKPEAYAPLRQDDPELVTLVIDYRRLEEVPAGSPQPEATRSVPAQEGLSGKRPDHAGGEDVQAIKDLLIKKDLEGEALKSEVGSLKRQLADREAQIEQLKRKDRSQSR